MNELHQESHRVTDTNESMIKKLLVISLLVIGLLLPISWITGLIEERQGRAEETRKNTFLEWGEKQTASGPILVLPYQYQKREPAHSKSKAPKTKQEIRKAYFLPKQLHIEGSVNPKPLNRGMYDVAVYHSELNFKAQFDLPDPERLGILPKDVLWKKAHLIFPLSHNRGIHTAPLVKVGNKTLKTEFSTHLDILMNPPSYPDDDYSVSEHQPPAEGIIAPLHWQSQTDFQSLVTAQLRLKGSQHLNFIPTAKETTVTLAGAWSAPSFKGHFLPTTRDITDHEFTATWNILEHHLSFPGQWLDTSKNLSGSTFGVNLYIPVDQYQMNIRTSKYAHLIIILTFVALLLVEIIRKLRIHPFQYILVGAALTIYYTLLLSISEHTGFTIAYWIATLATITLVTFYSTTFFKQISLTVLFSTLMSVFYAFIFVVILQEEFSLLLGSIGLFLVVAALMYFSRHVAWYKIVNVTKAATKKELS